MYLLYFALAAIAAYKGWKLWHESDVDLHEDARLHRMRQLNRQGDVE